MTPTPGQERQTDNFLHFVRLVSSFARKLSVYSELENMYGESLHCKRQGTAIVSYNCISLCQTKMFIKLTHVTLALRSTKFPATQWEQNRIRSQHATTLGTQYMGIQYIFRTPPIFQGVELGKNLCQRTQLDHTPKQYTSGQLNGYNIETVRRSTIQAQFSHFWILTSGPRGGGSPEIVYPC